MTDSRDEHPQDSKWDTDEVTAPDDASPSSLSPVEEPAPPEYPKWATASELKQRFAISPSNAHRWANPRMKRRRPVPRRRGPDGAIEFEVAGILAREEERKERLRNGHNPAANLRQNSGSSVGTKSLGARNQDGVDLGSDVGAGSRDNSSIKADVEGVGVIGTNSLKAEIDRMKHQAELDRLRAASTKQGLADDLEIARLQRELDDMLRRPTPEPQEPGDVNPSPQTSLLAQNMKSIKRAPFLIAQIERRIRSRLLLVASEGAIRPLQIEKLLAEAIDLFGFNVSADFDDPAGFKRHLDVIESDLDGHVRAAVGHVLSTVEQHEGRS